MQNKKNLEKMVNTSSNSTDPKTNGPPDITENILKYTVYAVFAAAIGLSAYRLFEYFR